MPRYAKKTNVPRSRTRDQIEMTLMRYGARTIFMNDTNEQNVLFIAWKLDGIPYKFELPLPNPDDREFTHTSVTEERRSAEKANDLWRQAINQYWRIANNYIHMLLEVMEVTGMEFHEAFGPLLALKNGSNVWMTAATQAQQIKHTGVLMELMPPEKG